VAARFDMAITVSVVDYAVGIAAVTADNGFR
jgi:hypothetical protein